MTSEPIDPLNESLCPRCGLPPAECAALADREWAAIVADAERERERKRIERRRARAE